MQREEKASGGPVRRKVSGWSGRGYNGLPLSTGTFLGGRELFIVPVLAECSY